MRYCILLLLIGFSCCKDKDDDNGKPKPGPVPVVNDTTKEKVYVINEGNFTFANGSVSLYTPHDGVVISDLFHQSNGRKIGDVPQSMIRLNGLGLITVNNSGKIEVVNYPGLLSLRQITGFVSPRFIAESVPGKAYVSDLYSDRLSVLDLNSMTVTGSIPCHGWSEEMLKYGNEMFVARMESRFMYVIDVNTDAVKDSIEVGYASSSIVKDNQDKLWVLCTGDDVKNEDARLVKVDPVTHAVITSFVIPAAQGTAIRLRINPSGSVLYYINKGVCRHPVTSGTFDPTPFIPELGPYWGLGVSPYTGIIYIADPIDYNQKGRVLRYNPDGTLIDQFTAGLIPGGFQFVK